MKFRTWRPSPSMVVAVAALVFAVAGTALAGVATISVLSKQEKKQVRKIANKQINKRASGLSVSSANTAKTAETANTANNVTNQLWAIVNADGSLFRSSPGIVGSTPDDPGKTLITADRDISGCFAVATLGGNSPNVGLRGDISVNPVTGSPDQLFVLTSDPSAVNSPIAFTVLIRC